MPLDNEKILEDTLSLFYLYLDNFAATKGEKTKVKKFYRLILNCIFNFSFGSMDYNESSMNEKYLMTKIHSIESEIFDKYFSLFSSLAEEERKENEKQNEGLPEASNKKSEDHEQTKKNTEDDLEFGSNNESEDEESFKESEMKYLTEDVSKGRKFSKILEWFLPEAKSENDITFFSTKYSFIFLRFFYSFYERILMVNLELF